MNITVHNRSRLPNKQIQAIGESVHQNPQESFKHRTQNFKVNRNIIIILKDHLNLFTSKVELRPRILRIYRSANSEPNL